MSLDPSLQLTQSVARLRDIPTFSIVLNEVMSLVRDPRASRKQIAQLLRRDQVLTAKILRLVNSGSFGRSHEITDVARALSFVGDDSVAALVLGTSVFSATDLDVCGGFDLMQFWRHSLAVALASEDLARRAELPNAEEIFTCGLLHDLGKIAIFRAEPQLMRKIVELAVRDGTSFLAAEQKLGLPGHNFLGERLAEVWNLPLIIRKVIRYHHRDIAGMESLYSLVRPAVMTVSLANHVAHEGEMGFSGHRSTPDVPGHYLEALKLNADDLHRCHDHVAGEMEKLEALFRHGSQVKAA